MKRRFCCENRSVGDVKMYGMCKGKEREYGLEVDFVRGAVCAGRCDDFCTG